jgi:hypothetical protein
VLTHPDVDHWIALDRTGKTQELRHGNSDVEAGELPLAA